MTRPESRPGLWRDGWYRFARTLRSPNFGPRPDGASVDLLVVHSISLPPGEYGGDQVQRLFTNRLDVGEHPWFERLRGLEVSAHFYIQRNGELWQFVSCDQRAWHAGQSCFQRRDNCNDFSVGIELEGLEGEGFEMRNTKRLQASAQPSRSSTRSSMSPVTNTWRRGASTIPDGASTGQCCSAHWGGRLGVFPRVFWTTLTPDDARDHAESMAPAT